MRNIAKWRCQLTEYDIEYVPRTSIKGQAIADHLAEFPIDDDTPINMDFPDEEILQIGEAKEEPTWKMYFDGAVNSVGSGVGAVLVSPDGRHYPVAAKVDFSCTNNVAEYEACILGLQAAIDFKVKELGVKNQFADAFATLASMASISEGNIIEPLEIEVAKGPAHCNAIEAFEAKSWYEDIRNFLQTGQYPPFADRRDRKTLRRLAMHYFLSGEILYRRSFDSTLLPVVALEVLLRAVVVTAAVAAAAVPAYLYVGSLSWVATVVALDVLLPAAAAAAVAAVLEMIGFG
ncbi:uncharacterized protein LOC116205722 [Punica granatum]|uniref:Uncharacterized protein LOC116205722 n=1 Tax=Punica granatum TaxID=22663 RepID=A0A6P8DLD2_PUNGR|nr:uncharacterized protein LOC116205722 [Punica granatum]